MTMTTQELIQQEREKNIDNLIVYRDYITADSIIMGDYSNGDIPASLLISVIDDLVAILEESHDTMPKSLFNHRVLMALDWVFNHLNITELQILIICRLSFPLLGIAPDYDDKINAILKSYKG